MSSRHRDEDAAFEEDVEIFEAVSEEIDDLLDRAMVGEDAASLTLMTAAMGLDAELLEELDRCGDPRWGLLWAHVYGPIFAPRARE